jgi:hypothetical protein
MASMRENVKKSYEMASAHHGEMAKSHEALAKCYSGMCKADGSAETKMYESIANEHGAMAKNHAAAAEFFGGAADECAKSIQDSLNKLVPDRVSSVGSIDDPNFGIRAIPRAGAPAIGVLDKSAVPVQFRHLIASDPDDI